MGKAKRYRLARLTAIQDRREQAIMSRQGIDTWTVRAARVKI
jgi:hypothetical protein